MPFGEGFKFNFFKRKDEGELRAQVESAEERLDVSPKEKIVPPKHQEDLMNLPFNDLKERFGARYDMYLRLLREQKQMERVGNENGMQINNDEILEMKKWLSALNSLDEYIAKYAEGEEDTLYEEQLTVFEDLRKFLETGKKDGYIKLPTGTGKTVLFSEFVEALGLKTLIVTPKKLLVRQTEKAFHEFAEDIDVGKIYSNAKQYGRAVTITTYDSLVAGLRNGTIHAEDYECLILDEVHESLSDARANAVDQFKGKVRIGFTATPEFSDKKKVSQLLEHEIHRMEIREAVKDGLLSPVTCIVARTEVDLDSVPLTASGEYSEEELKLAVNIAGRNQVAIEFYLKNTPNELAVVYCVGVEHAKLMADKFYEAGVPATYISGAMDDEKQQQILDGYASGKYKVLCNADILVAGFNEPKASVCLNLRPTRSRVVAEQRAGRVLRVDKNNSDKHALVVDFLDKSGELPVIFPQIIDTNQIVPKKKRREGEEGDDREVVDYIPMRPPIIDVEGLDMVTDYEEVLKIVRERERVDKKDNFLSLEELKTQVLSEGIVDGKQYVKVYKEHPGWPSTPAYTYGEKWPGWKIFLNKEAVEFLSLDELQKQVLAADVQDEVDYKKIKKDHKDWPYDPAYFYKGEWQNWREFLKKNNRFLSYDAMRLQVKEKGVSDWGQYQKVYKNHPGWPSNPYATYRDEWNGYPEFFGKEVVEFFLFEKAREVVRSAKIKNNKEYKKEYKKYPGLPAVPSEIYKDQWISWPEFLGTEVADLSYTDLREQVRSAGIKTGADYVAVYKNHPGWPSTPASTYGEQWPGWIEFLGKESVSLLPMEEVKLAVRSLLVDTKEKYTAVYKNHKGWPSNPSSCYKDQWISWPEFLGTEDRFLSYEELQAQVKERGVKSSPQYKKESKRQKNWPSDPQSFYDERWMGWDSFFERSDRFLSYVDLQAQVKAAGITDNKGYSAVYKNHPGWPSNPNHIYKNQWKGWSEFFGKEVAEFLTLSKLQDEVRAAGITDNKGYSAVYKNHPGWPSNPPVLYEDVWQGWKEFFGTKIEFLKFDAFKKQVREAKITTPMHYIEVYKNHPGWPSTPKRTYGDSWPGWAALLGEFTPSTAVSTIETSVESKNATHERPASFKEFRRQLREAKIRSISQYEEVYRDHPGWPASPHIEYGEQWPGWKEFFKKKKKKK